jgi:iron complex transport system substrate-binding protein
VPRIASLLPSATEIACALGFEKDLVGRSHECDHPPGVAALPALTRPRLDAGAPSAAIDARVKELVARGLSVYDVDAELLRQLAPDVILTQDQCEVCAASPTDLEAALADWLGARPRLVSLSPVTLGDVWGDLARVAAALGAPERGSALCEALADRVTEVAERTGRLRPRPGVACVEWLDPLMAAGNWVPELVALAGGRDVLGRAGAHSAWISVAELAAANPDVVVLLPCGFDLARTRSELPALAQQKGWDELRAVRERRVFATDGNQFFNRPGPRLVESLEILAEILHPQEFAPRHRGSGWEVT